jgi:hypothetical protein
MEAQNHFYGHSAALAAYVGLPRPRHIAGLVQHGWTAASPVDTHFRDFPALRGDSDRRWPTGPRRLFVWSHESRGWTPDPEVETVPIGAQLLYLDAVAGPGPTATRPTDRTVILPVHGIETQRIRGDHAGLARSWAEAEGAATVCLYAADARDPDILAAYRGAGHHCVVLGQRMDAAFLWRLWTMLGRAERVVSNRLSTPVVYAAHLGADVAVYGDPLALDGERTDANDRVRELWPEFHGEHLDRDAVRRLAATELGAAHVRPAAELRTLLGWERSTVPQFADYWTLAPLQRARIQMQRRSPAPTPAPTPADGAGLSPLDWLRGAFSYLPRALPRRVPAGPAEPLEVDDPST